MIIQNEQELEALRKIGRIVALAREEMRAAAKPGMTTKELDLIGKRVLDEHGAVSAPEKEYDFPGVTCISVNEEVAHGIPGDRVIQDGDLVNIDISAALDGFYADTGISFVVGQSDDLKERLCKAAEDAFWAAMKKVKAGAKRNQIGRAVFNEARKSGFNVIENLTGHGIGRSLHEAPEHIFNYFEPRDTVLLKDGLVLAVEPFVSAKADHIVESGDGWTFITPDKSLVAQCEHTIVVTKGEPIILTAL
ncbi:type I methionyl aminopeptidase [Ectobacillus ponti]|uniref:Methionine aminopeptidase n=1 Tax=Ectobacillus ponti TaxID=2961894 RepID=A0AA41X2Y2_9BACI|nr:type I methionyl aminopeptidase [Ectobacillus ponti]MCP8967979.1 type I methionyl aminopeptidase [Ectobacillus ponti]